MCGRARCTLRPEQVTWACCVGGPGAGPLATVDLDKYRPSYNVSPGVYLPVVAYLEEKKAGAGAGGEEGKVGEKRPVLHCMKWGLVPSFTKKTEKPDHYRMFNARSESVCEKASFRRLMPKNRCLVAVEGYYEWKKDGSKKQPYYIHLKDGRPLVFAALYDSWQNAEGEVLYTFTILTTNSSSALQWLHDRMPVILGNKTSIDVWLNNPTSKIDSVGPYEGLDLVWYQVTPAMGKPSFDGPECIKEILLKPAVKKPISKYFSKKIDDGKQPKLDVQEMHFPETTKQPVIECVKEPVRVKDPVKIEETEFPIALEDSKKDSNPHVSHQIKKTEIFGTKRDYEQLVTDSKSPSGSIDDLKKKGRANKHADGGQATLFSYFGRS